LKTIFQHIVPVLLALVICSAGICWAIVIKVTGNWSVDIGASNLQAGAGSDLWPTYESTDPITIDITETVGDWAVVVKKIDGDWHTNLHLFVKRTSDGTGSVSISGGSSYQEVTDTDQPFFNGNGDVTGVNVRLQLTGVSIQVPPDEYRTTIYYTVSDPF